MVKFKDAMTRSSNYAQKMPTAEWQLIEDLYENAKFTTKQIIPKTIHQIWLGGPVPDQLNSYIATVKAANPGYYHMLWTDEWANKLNFANKELFNSCKNLGQKSDILRYAVLERFGGIYLDTDFVGVRSFDSLLSFEFFTGIAYDKEPNMFNGLLGCVPGHTVIRALNDIKEVSDHDGMSIIRTTGPYFLTKKFFENTKSTDNSVVLPVEYFYPYPNFGIDKKLGNNYADYITERTICVHLWDSRWN